MVELPAESVNPSRLFSGTIQEKSKPGWTFRVGSRRGPGVLLKSRSSSRIVIYTLPLKTGFERPNELRGTTLTEPARAEPCDSGVGEYETSTRAALLIP